MTKTKLKSNKYLYNGKELQDDQLGGVNLDLYDYGRRMYDPELGRFTTQDRFAENYLDFSPYQYAANNPIMFVDVNGDSIVSITRKDNKILIVNSPLEKDGENYTNTIVLSGSSVTQDDISDKSVGVVNDAMNNTSDTEVDVTSGKRSPKDQARVMYANLGKYGVAKQKALYGSYGDKVIDVYQDWKGFENEFSANFSSQTKASMVKKINQLGPGNVSKHCSSDNNLNVFDIDPNSVNHVQNFQNHLQSNTKVSKVIPYPKDPGIHVEIKF